MPTNTPVQEPDFEGEKMKMPEQDHDAVPTEAPQDGGNNQLAILLLLTLVLVAILGGLFIWFTNMMEATRPAPYVPPTVRPTAEENNEPESTTAEVSAESMNVVSTSDELSAIEADLESTNIADIDTDVPAIESELNAALEAQ